MTHTEDDKPEYGPIDKQAILSKRIDSLMNSGVSPEAVTAERFPYSAGGLGEACAWFLACDNEAVRTRRHPVMAVPVPICNRCDCLAEARS